MASQFYDMLDRIDGAERIECDADPLRCRTDCRIVFRNGSELKILTPSSRERNAGERLDRILYEEDTAYRDRLEYMALECGPARFDDVIGTVEANREEMGTTYDGVLTMTTLNDAGETYAYAERPYYNTTIANSAWCTSSPDYYWMPTTTTSASSAWAYTGPQTGYYGRDQRRRNVKYQKLLDRLREKPEKDNDDIDNEAFDKFMRKLENGEELK